MIVEVDRGVIFVGRGHGASAVLRLRNPIAD
jgi:hypothetical protein